MDALQQHPHTFMRPPPPPPPPPQPPAMLDPDHHLPHPAAPTPPPLPQASWYPNQFQYHAQPPPQPHPQQSVWPPTNHSDHQPQQPIPSSYPPPHHPPYPTHPPPHPQNHYYPPPPPPPPHQNPPYQHPQHLQPYAQPQAWGNANWAHHQVWEHSDGNHPNNNEDWAAKAKAWAAAKNAMDVQHQPSQFTHINRIEEQSHGFQDQYQRPSDSHYANIQQSSLPASYNQQFSVSIGDLHRGPANHRQDSSSFGSGPSSYYSSNLHASYTSRDTPLGADQNHIYPHQGNIATNSSGYQQEVPSSYSSVPGKGEVGSQDVQLHSSDFPISSGQETQHHRQHIVSASGRSISEEHPYFAYGVGSASSLTDPSDRPLEFAPGFSRNHDSHDQYPQTRYTPPDATGPLGYVDHATPVPSVSALTSPVIPGMGYPSSGSQFDHSFVPHSPMFGQIPGPNFRPNGAAFGLGAGTILHPTVAFPGDPNGVASVSDRPKKASVPNWLREEIIKKKAVIANSSQDHFEEDPDNPSEDDSTEKSFVKRGPTDNKSIHSSRSSDNEDEDEDAMEVARTAAINQEIKRVVTEVLLKVTDELFEEIATKVLNEDDLVVKADHNNVPPNRKLSPSPPSVPVLKASAKVLLPVKTKEPKSDDASGKSPFRPTGDVLGLGSYASDDDDYDETPSKSSKNEVGASPLQASSKISTDTLEVAGNVRSEAETEGPSGIDTYSDPDKTVAHEAFNNAAEMGKRLRENDLEKNSKHEKDSISFLHREGKVTKEGPSISNGENLTMATDDPKSMNIVEGKSSMEADLLQGDSGSKSSSYITQASESRSKSDKIQERESKRSYVSNDSAKDVGSGKLKLDSKQSGAAEPRKDERRSGKEKTDDRNGVKERGRDRGPKSGDKARESDSRSSRSKDDKIDTEKMKKDSSQVDNVRKRGREKDDKEDRSRHHGGRDSNTHKRRHSPSVGGRARNSKDKSVGNESSEDASDDSRRRKRYSRKHSSSPSPTRSKRRQVSRSPHSKHSHRRQSPYSSLDSKRGRRSRSNSPVRRRR